MWPFKCKHPAEYVHVYAEQSREWKKVNTEFPYESVTTHLYCRNCGERFTIKHADVRSWDKLYEEKYDDYI